jgi:PAS domain S-box-containing protein
VASTERFLTTTSLTEEKQQGKPIFFHWSKAGIRTKILAPLIILMFFSLLGSTVGFILSTNTTRNDILDGQLHEESSRLDIALKQSEEDVKNGAIALSKDPEIIKALQKDTIGSDVIMKMDSRATPVRDRFFLHQIVIRNKEGINRVNIATYSDLTEQSFYEHESLANCHQTPQIHFVPTDKTTLLVGCAPIQAKNPSQQSAEQTMLGVVYTVQDVPRRLERIRRDLGLSAEIKLLDHPQSAGASAQSLETGSSMDGYRVRLLPLSLAGTDIAILLSLSEQEINEIVGSGFRVMVISSGLTFLLLLSVGVWLAQSFTRPILKLDAVAQAVAAGDLKRRANLSHDDEIGRLGRSFDQATATIAHLLDQQARTAGERHAILQSMADGLLAVDVDERIIMINPVAADLLGQTSAALLSKPLLNLTNVEDTVLAIGLQQVVDQIRSELHDPDMDKTEEHISLGDRVVRLHSAPTMGSGNRLTGAVVVLQDITEEVEADRAKSAFIGTASHELRTPLASMKGFVDIFYMSGIDNLTESQTMFLDTIKRQTENMVQLVNDLLEMARLEQGSLRGEQQWVALPHVVEESLTSLKPQVEHRAIQLNVDISPDIPHIWIDALHLRRIVTNLFSNAMKYSYHGGSVNIRVYELRDPTLLPSSPDDQPWKYGDPRSLVVEVEDKGVGIRESDQSKIFTRFFRSDNELSVEAGGSGLGLAITRSLVHLHHGQIGFHSIEKEGSCFWVRLPAPSTEALTNETNADGQEYQAVEEE